MVDFMVLMPLGTQLMRAFDITPTQLGFFVSIYAVAASLSGFFSALVIDRFDRKTAMLALYACFAATMAACALAPSYATLLAARTAAGAFGGVVAANIFTIVADVVPENRRGRAFGAVMSAFSLASILGVPISLYLALHFTWRAPYVFLAALCSAILLAAWFAIPPVRDLCRGRDRHRHRGARDDEPAALAALRRGARFDAHVRGILGAHGACDGVDHLGCRAASARQRDELQFLDPAARRRRGLVRCEHRRGPLGRGRADPLLDDRHPLGGGDVRVHRARSPGALGRAAVT